MATYADAHLEIDFARRAVVLDGRPLVLTQKEYELIAFLVCHAGQLVTRSTLLRCVWGYGEAIRTRTLDAHVARLRARLGPHSGCIETVFRAGYRFRAVPAPLSSGLDTLAERPASVGA